MNDDLPTRRTDPDDFATAVELRPGAIVFGRYELRALLGKGGMGMVWRAHDTELEREVALKFILPSVAADKEAVRDLKRETRRCLELTHENIVHVYDFVKDGRHAAIAMEFVDGESLAARKADAPGGCLGVAELTPLVAPLCAALDYAHRRAKVAHRDLKPANLLVTAAGELKVTDFGIAASLSENTTRLTGRAGDTSGTLPFMSPQQIRGEKPTAADDIYALGATLYDLLAGKPPFFRGDLTHQILSEQPKPVATQRADLGNEGAPIPRAWEETIAACLAKEPAQRPQNANDVAERMRSAEGGMRQATSPPEKPRGADDYATKVLVPKAGSARLQAASGERESEDRRGLTEQARVQAVLAKQNFPEASRAWENTLGMKFAPVPGVDGLFGVWDVRVQDYQAFASATQRAWPKPGFEQSPSHPAVGVSWDEAKAFCAWLTEKERREGLLGPNQSYRLPQDREWSVAVGLDEARGGTPQSKDAQIKGIYPWGTQWPPPRGAGNYADEAAKRAHSNWTIIAGYDDGFADTSPVGSFAANRHGLYDMGGNVWQWCEDFYDRSSGSRVLRGASFVDYIPDFLLSSYRNHSPPVSRFDGVGFRCVVAVGGASSP